MRVGHRCPVCNSKDITFDCNAKWDEEKQVWDYGEVGEYGYCNDCDYDGNRILLVDLDKESNDTTTVFLAAGTCQAAGGHNNP